MIRLAKVMPAIFLIAAACNKVDTTGNLKVVGGDETNENSAVVRLEVGGTCTGTFISPDTILTAAHCYHAAASYAGIAAAKIIRHPGFQGSADGKLEATQMAVDLMILKFDRALAPATVRIASQPPSKGDKARMIGFGCSSLDTGEGVELKRAGEVTITLVDSGVIGAYKNSVYGCPGDSGGPVFNASGEQIGVASTASHGRTNWVNLTSISSQGFLKNAVSGGSDQLAGNYQPNSQLGGNPLPGNQQQQQLNQQQQYNQGSLNYFTLNGRTYSCPAGSVLYTDGYCYAGGGYGGGNYGGSNGNLWTLNGVNYNCPSGFYLGVDAMCHRS